MELFWEFVYSKVTNLFTILIFKNGLNLSKFNVSAAAERVPRGELGSPMPGNQRSLEEMEAVHPSRRSNSECH